MWPHSVTYKILHGCNCTELGNDSVSYILLFGCYSIITMQIFISENNHSNLDRSENVVLERSTEQSGARRKRKRDVNETELEEKQRSGDQ